MTPPTLGEYLRRELMEGKIDFCLRAHINVDGIVQFYIHPDGKDGRTGDYIVSGNALAPPKNITYS